MPSVRLGDDLHRREGAEELLARDGAWVGQTFRPFKRLRHLGRSALHCFREVSWLLFEVRVRGARFHCDRFL